MEAGLHGARQAKGQFILTSSATPDDDARRHTGAGRFAVIQMRPMSLYETGHSTGQVSLAAMFDGEAPRAFDAENLKWMAALVDDNRCAFLAVLTNGGMATRRPDGVDVVPLRMLAP